jgi:hypothetical protein
MVAATLHSGGCFTATVAMLTPLFLCKNLVFISSWHALDKNAYHRRYHCNNHDDDQCRRFTHNYHLGLKGMCASSRHYAGAPAPGASLLIIIVAAWYL